MCKCALVLCSTNQLYIKLGLFLSCIKTKRKKIRQIDSFLKRIFLKVVCNSKPNAYIYIFSHLKIQMSHHYYNHYLKTSLQAFFLFPNFLLHSTSVYSIILKDAKLRCNIDLKSRSSKKKDTMQKNNFSNLFL